MDFINFYRVQDKNIYNDEHSDLFQMLYISIRKEEEYEIVNARYS